MRRTESHQELCKNSEQKKNPGNMVFDKFPPFPMVVAFRSTAPNPSGNLVRRYISELRSFIIQFVTSQPSAGEGCNSSVIPADGLMYKKALMLTSFPDRSTYLLAPTTSNLSLAYCAHITCAFCSNIPSELSNIQLKTEVTSYLISKSDRLPYDLASDSSFTFIIELLWGTNQTGSKLAMWNTTNTMAGLLQVHLC